MDTAQNSTPSTATPVDGEQTKARLSGLSTIGDPSFDTTYVKQSPPTDSPPSAGSVVDPKESGAHPNFSKSKKYFLLFLFSLGLFIDILCYSAFFVFTDSIASDLNVRIEQQSWVITSYAVTFAAFLLFWGRVSDLYSAAPVFNFGFLGLGVLSLIISFLTDKYSFFVLRALSGICGACLIPAAYRLIVYVFEPQELEVAFALYGMSGAISNVMGTLVAGFISYIPGGGQMESWRWFFRILSFIIIPGSLLCIYLVPHPKGAEQTCPEGIPRWKRLDIIGALIMLSVIVLLILGLTFGASYGWKTAKFLVPFLLSWVLFPLFFVWESVLPEPAALLPNKTWRIRNFALWIIFSLQIYAWWSVNFLALIEVFIAVHHEHPIIAALRVLPEGFAAFVVIIVLSSVPTLVSRPRWTVAIGMSLGVAAYALMAQPKRYVGEEYWRWLFPAFIIGSGGTAAAFTAVNVGTIVSVPPEMAGVAGAVLQIGFQVGGAVGLSIQAGLLTSNPGGVFNYKNIRNSFYWQMGWCALWLIMFLAFYRNPKKSEDGEEGPRPIIV